MRNLLEGWNPDQNFKKSYPIPVEVQFSRRGYTMKTQKITRKVIIGKFDFDHDIQSHDRGQHHNK